MNKFRYRIVFNQARGCLMAVAETAASQGKGTAGECLSTTSVDTQRTIRATLTNLGLACKLLAGSLTVWLPLSVISPLGVQAQTVATRIVADPTAPSSQRPTVLTTSNGVVQVDIRTPSAAGVSRNTYRQFDVGATGAILNNSRTSVQTQQGGWVQGNPWLAKGSARVILNEVNSNNPSYLQGYVEVTGQRAQVIIANPSGIAINGGGFINASGVTLTTGTSNLNTGALESFRVQGGQITVDGLGLDTRSADYTAILSRAAQVNAGIWAQQLQVVTGVNDIPATSVGADTQIQSTLVTSTAAAPAYALDVATLGGMYAGKIQLIGTEAGLGVRNAGLLQASSGPLTLNHQGWLSNSGSMQASGGNVQIQTQDRIDQSGTLYSDKNVQLISNANQNHSGTTAALGDVSIRAVGLNANGTAANIQATKTSAWAAGLQTEGQITGQQNLMLQASGQLQTAGQALASQTLSMQASSLGVAQSRQQAPTITLQAISGDLQATGSRILAGQNLRLEAAKTLTTDQAEVQAQTLTLQANALSNKAGQITQTGSTEQSIRLQGTFDNTAGVIYSAAHTLNISAQSIDNTAGQILHAGQGTLAIVSQNQLTNLLQSSIQAAVTDGARIIGAGSLHLQAQDFSNSGSIYAAHDLSSTAKSLSNSGSLYAGGAQTLTVTEAVQSSGTIAAAKDLAIQADNLSGTSTSVLAAGMATDGKLSGTGALIAVTTGALQSAGQVLATSGMSLAGSSLYLAGSQTGTTAGDVSLIASSGDINTRQAQVSTPGKLSIAAISQSTQKLDNTEGLISASRLNIEVGKLMNGQGGIEQTSTDSQIANIHSAGSLDNSSGRFVINAKTLTLTAGELSNTLGLIAHAGIGTLHLVASDLKNADGQIIGNGQIEAQISQDLNNTKGQIHAQKSLSLHATQFKNTEGLITSAQTSTLQAAQALNNQKGLIAAEQALSIHAGALNNQEGVLASVQSTVELASAEGGLNNLKGQIQAASDLSMVLSGAGNRLNNQSGIIFARRNASLDTGAIDNRLGLINAAKDLDLQTHSQTLMNQGSSPQAEHALGILAGGQMLLRTGDINNQGGLIHAQGLSISAANMDNRGLEKTAGTAPQSALIYSANDANLHLQSLDNRGGQLLAVNHLSVGLGSGTLDNTGSLIRAGQTMSLSAGRLQNSQTYSEQSPNNAAQKGIDAQSIAITSEHLDNTQGAIRASTDLTIQSNNLLRNTLGLLSAAQALRISPAQTVNQIDLILDNQAGKIVADGNIEIQASQLQGEGQIQSQGRVSLSLQGDHATSGTLRAGTDLTLQTTGTLTNAIPVHAGKNLTVTARDIDNTVSGEFVSAAVTQVTAKNKLTNHGLIDGVETRLNARSIDNLGTGRIYGDQISIAAETLNNREETVNGVTHAATIAARQRLDMGVQILTNREGALIYSAGDLNIGGKLDDKRRVIDAAQSVNNNSATVEAGGSLNIQTVNLNNTNEHFVTESILISGPTAVLEIQPAGSSSRINRANLFWEDWDRAGQYRYDTTPIAVGNSSNLGSAPIPEVGQSTCVGDGDAAVCTKMPGTDYLATDPAWTYFAVLAPQVAPVKPLQPVAPALEKPEVPDEQGKNSCEQGSNYNAQQCEIYTQAYNVYTTQKLNYGAAWNTYNADLTQYQTDLDKYTSDLEAWEQETEDRYAQLDAKIETYNQQFSSAIIRQWTQYQYDRRIYETQIKQTAPGQILAAQNVHLQADRVINDKSQIVAGASLTLTGGSLSNIAGEGESRIVDLGTVQSSSIYSRRGGTFRTGRKHWYRSYSSAADYAPPDQVTVIDLNAVKYQANAAYTASGAQATYLQVSAVQDRAQTGKGVQPLSVDAPSKALAGAQGEQTALAQEAQNRATANQTGVRTQQVAQVRYLSLSAQMPNTSLYRQHPETGAKYLVETDPQFTQYKTWLGSDFMTAQLQFDPATTQKRMGDGFYEQKLVREQVQALTGQRFLGDYANDEAQYMALMNNGLTTAKALQLRPGIALSATQVAQLTSDMVWLVTQEVTLPDGSKQSVLVPQVYVRIKDGDVDGTGALLAGKDVQLNLTGDVSNSGTIAGRNLVSINAQNIKNLGGQISADTLALNAQQDIDNIGGQMQAQSAALLSAGRDINLRTTTQSSANRVGNNSFTQTGIDRVAGLYVSGPAGVLIASAGRDINLTAAQFQNTGTGATSLNAANNLNLGTVTTSTTQNINWSGVNYLRQSQSQDVGTQINAAGNLTLTAGQDLNAKAASVNTAGTLSAVAGNNINITQGQSSQSLDEAIQIKSSGFLSKSATTTRTSTASTNAVASNLEGASVSIAAGQDLSIKGSNILADQSVNLSAGRNTSIEATQDTRSSSSFTETKKSGLMSGGGLSITIGKQQQSLDQGLQQSTVAASTVGAINGNVTIKAGGAYTQTGSDVLTPGGNIAITAQKVDITEARETGSQSTEQKFKQSGLTVALSGGVIDTAQAAMQGIQGATGGGSDRSKALNALIAYGKGTDLYEQGKAVSDAYDKNGVLGNTGADGKANPGATAASGIKISIGLGGSTSQSNSNTITNRGAGSTVKAGGSVNIQATGQGPVDGDLTVQGSKVQAAQNTTLSATKDVNIVASSDTETNRITNKSSAASVGVSFGIGPGSAGLSLDIAASKGKGQANGDSTNYTNSQIEAGQKLSISSGADTNVVGGSIKATQVTASVGGNLNIQSLQDTATSQASQKTTGVALSIPITGAGGSASISQAKQGSNSNYASVNEQSGIQAGDGGFQVNVKNNTDLKGASIVSTASADKNSLSTGTLTTSDISNSMSASASSSGFSMGTNMLDGKYALAKTVAGNAMNKGAASQSDASTTTTAISGAQVTVNGKTTDTSKDQLTDSNGKSVSTDTGNTNRTLAKADVAGLQQQAQQKQADNMLVFKAATAFTDEAYRTMYKAGAQMYKVPPGCSDKSCAVALTEQEAMALKTSQDGKVHLSNNGIFNDLDGAVKYAQQHGGTINVDDSKNYSEKPESQYIIFAPQTNNVLSELIVAGVQKSGLTPTVGLTNAEEQTATRVQQAIQQGQSIVIDSHSRGALTTDNALWSIHNQVGSKDETGNTTKADVQLNNYGGAQSNETGNKTLQQVTGNGSAQINSVIHTKDLIGESVLVGRNPASPQYTSTAADGTKTTVEAKDDGRNPISNAINIMTGTATPHNCYGTAGGTEGCTKQWDNIPTSNAPKIEPNANYRPSVVIPQYQQVDKVTPQFKQDSNSQMNQLLQPVGPQESSTAPPPNRKLEILQNFKKGL